jgi:hypothetical protein
MGKVDAPDAALVSHREALSELSTGRFGGVRNTGDPGPTVSAGAAATRTGE